MSFFVFVSSPSLSLFFCALLCIFCVFSILRMHDSLRNDRVIMQIVILNSKNIFWEPLRLLGLPFWTSWATVDHLPLPYSHSLPFVGSIALIFGRYIWVVFMILLTHLM